MTITPEEIDRAALGRSIVQALIRNDGPALRAGIESLPGSREQQLTAALALVYAEMEPAYCQADPEAAQIRDGANLANEVTEWLRDE